MEPKTFAIMKDNHPAQFADSMKDIFIPEFPGEI